MIVLGIETSCDETGIAVYDSERGLVVHKLYSQTAIHTEFGGVVPELASRDHVRKILPLIKRVMDLSKLKSKDIGGVAYTAGPGLVGALLVGAVVGCSIGMAWNVPVIGVHHMEGHLLAPLMEKNPPDFPFIALLVSGGHTLLVKAVEFGNYEILGESLDDAAGEAFDKVAKMLELPYPGGPAVAELAKQGNPDRFHFPRPMVDRPGLDFSFSGLKTFTLNTLRECGDDLQTKADVACAFQSAVVDALTIKCKRALKQTGIDQLIIAGGVSANQSLRTKLDRLGKKENVRINYPKLEFCTDNGAMIAYAGLRRLQTDQENVDLGIQVFPRWNLSDL